MLNAAYNCAQNAAAADDDDDCDNQDKGDDDDDLQFKFVFSMTEP